ncbi:receptor activity-modifying protein 1 [Anableps anableps]
MILSALLLTLSLIWTGTAVKVIPPCDQNTFHFTIHDCRSNFNRSMETSGYQEKCPWPDVKPLYNSLRMCVEASVQQTWCMGHTFMVDEVFLEVHQTYFSLCRLVQDPPLRTLLVLMAPGVVITLFLPFLCAHLTIGEAGDV